jgi:hypothetical protein
MVKNGFVTNSAPEELNLLLREVFDSVDVRNLAGSVPAGILPSTWKLNYLAGFSSHDIPSICFSIEFSSCFVTEAKDFIATDS